RGGRPAARSSPAHQQAGEGEHPRDQAPGARRQARGPVDRRAAPEPGRLPPGDEASLDLRDALARQGRQGAGLRAPRRGGDGPDGGLLGRPCPAPYAARGHRLRLRRGADDDRADRRQVLDQQGGGHAGGLSLRPGRGGDGRRAAPHAPRPRRRDPHRAGLRVSTPGGPPGAPSGRTSLGGPAARQGGRDGRTAERARERPDTGRRPGRRRRWEPGGGGRRPRSRRVRGGYAAARRHPGARTGAGSRGRPALGRRRRPGRRRGSRRRWFLMLMPKRVKHRKVQRGRMRGNSKGGHQVAFGEYGLKALERGWITNRQIEAARVAMTRKIKRGGKVWINVFPDKPFTKKPAETRMGSGKGNPEGWVAV